jgi:integrase
VGRLQRWLTIGDFGSPWTVDEARARARELLSASHDGLDPQLEKQKARNALTVSELVDRYLNEGPHAKPNKRASSWANDRSVLCRHVVPSLGKRLARDLVRRDVERLQADIAAGRTAGATKTKARGVARVTGGRTVAGGTMRSLSAMFAWAIRQGYVEANPCAGVEKIKPGRRERYLSSEEARRLLATLTALVDERAIDESHAAIFRILLFTGARRSEIANLEWREVDRERARIVLPAARSKTGDKVIALNSAALAQIEGRPQTSTWVFPALRGSEGPTVGLYKSWSIVRVRAGLQGLRIHDLRHSFASFAAAQGASLYVIGKALGHSQAATTQRYAHLTDDPVRRAAEDVAAQILRTGA